MYCRNIMQAKIINDQNTWDEFVISCPSYTFFQGYLWGEFSQKRGEKIFKFGFYDDSKLIGVALLCKVFARRGTYLFCPHGPIFKKEDSKYWKFFFEFVKNLGRQEKVVFVRVSPVSRKDHKLEALFKKANFLNAPIHMSAESAWILNLKNKSEEEILSEMRKTTRYEIKKAEKENHQVIKSTDAKDLKIFLQLYHQLINRQNFTPFSDSFLTDEFSTFVKNGNAMLFLEKYKNQFVASLMIIFYGRGAYYHQGATKPLRGSSVSYLAQWEAIKEAKSRGLEFYNFWGIAPNDNSKHPWFGLSLFKKGFGGEQVDFIHAQDFPINWPEYLPTYIFETFRRIKRGY